MTETVSSPVRATTATPSTEAAAPARPVRVLHVLGSLNRGGVETWFLHLSQVLVAPGETVAGGQVIALSGDTGTGTAPHFHLETHVGGVPVDPVTFLSERGVTLGAGSS